MINRRLHFPLIATLLAAPLAMTAAVAAETTAAPTTPPPKPATHLTVAELRALPFEARALAYFELALSLPHSHFKTSSGTPYAGERFQAIPRTEGAARVYIPIFQSGEVAAIARFDLPDSGNRGISGMSKADHHHWRRYPPIEPARADALFFAHHDPDAYRRLPEPRIVIGDVPAYAYRAVGDGEREIRWVHALDGRIIDDVATFQREPDIDLHAPGRLAADGTIETDATKLQALPEALREEWVREVAIANRAIRAGSLVLDRNLEVVVDHRPESSTPTITDRSASK